MHMHLPGHVPMLADPVFSEMVTAIGRASLGADDKQVCMQHVLHF